MRDHNVRPEGSWPSIATGGAPAWALIAIIATAALLTGMSAALFT